MNDTPEYIICHWCGRLIEVETVPDEKPDGTMLGYATAHCKHCGWLADEEDIYQ